MDPITGMVEKNVIQSAWNYVRNWFHRGRDQRKRIEFLETQLNEERSGKIAFEKLVSELDCRPADDHMYWKKNGSGGPYCPLCLHGDEKLMPLTHGNRDGCFYCRIHNHNFETEELRERDRQAIQNRAAAGRRRSRFGPTQWS
jgi:hypothetical protein